MKKRRAKLAAGLTLFCLSLAGGASFAAEFEVLDRLSVDGYAVLRGSADIPGGSFAVGGSTFVVNSGNIGIGTVAPAAKLQVVGGRIFNIANNEPYSFAAQYGAGVGQFYFGATNAVAADGVFGNSAGTERVRITDSGNVGIGTTSPAYQLDVQRNGNGTAGTTGILNLNFTAASNTQAIQITQSNAGGNGSAASALFKITNSGSNPYLNFDDKLFMTQTGNVGIGTTNPGPYGHLEVYGPSYQALAALSASGTIGVIAANAAGEVRVGAVSNHPLALLQNNLFRLYIDTNGNVGAGTASPAARLDVYGVGSGAAPATAGTTDATMNFRAGRGSVGVDIGMMDSGTGYLQNRSINNFATNYNFSLQPNGGNVGIGTTGPAQKLSVAGTVESTAGGFKFPDGTTQATAAAFIGQRQISVDAAGGNSPGNPMFTKFMAFNTFTATKMSVLMYNWANGGKGKMAIYASHAGNDRPEGSPLAQTAEFISNGATDTTYISQLTAPYTLTAGNFYWLAIISDTTLNAMQASGSARTSIAQWYTQPYASGFPSISTVGSGWYGQAIAAFP